MFSAPCFLAIYEEATSEMNDAEQLLPVVLLRGVLEEGEVIAAVAEYQHHVQFRRISCASEVWPQGTPCSPESTAPAAQHLCQHHKLSKQRWT